MFSEGNRNVKRKIDFLPGIWKPDVKTKKTIKYVDVYVLEED